MARIERQKRIIDFTLSSLLRRKGKNLALIAAYSWIVFLLASVLFITEAIRREAGLVLQDAPEIIVQRLVAGRQESIPVAYGEKIKTITGVRSVKGRLWGYYYDPTNGANYTLVVEEDRLKEAGRVIIGEGVARNVVGESYGTMPFVGYDGAYYFFEVAETLPADSSLVAADLIIVSATDFRALFGIAESLVTDIVVEVRNPREFETIAAKIKAMLPDTRPVLRDEILRTYDTLFDWRGGLIVIILLGSLMAFIIFAWDKATGLSAEEKREIGILKALGWETADVLMIKFWEGATVSLLAFFNGVLLAYAHVFLTESSLFEPVLKGWSVLYPRFALTPYINAYQLWALFFLTVVPYTVATIIPSWRAAIIDPDSVMRT
ncbi:MAG: FtsX-like permease family protein [Desulfosarcinaceae bacterium]|nr:FtsX-like permease family protein [Desulfosarcinaceae bacterium]